MIRLIINFFNLLRFLLLRFLLVPLNRCIGFFLFKRLSDSLVLDKFTKKLHMDLTINKYGEIRKVNNEKKLEILIEDFMEALGNLKSNRIYKVNVNSGFYAILLRKLRSNTDFQIEIVKKKHKRQMSERSLLMTVSSLFKCLILMKNNEDERLIYKKLEILKLKIHTK
ncbi:hypothetical protein [Paenibacillus campi]|uniref:hypothetical protein n=1 Tax=Paenibacillus campi TaxID=3106031 RepID=UPI002AFE902F|nr:hypothetical protein [Paenibacillus sp. SGZ-1014]